MNHLLFFLADDGVHGRELWVVNSADGAPAPFHSGAVFATSIPTIRRDRNIANPLVEAAELNVDVVHATQRGIAETAERPSTTSTYRVIPKHVVKVPQLLVEDVDGWRP